MGYGVPRGGPQDWVLCKTSLCSESALQKFKVSDSNVAFLSSSPLLKVSNLMRQPSRGRSWTRNGGLGGGGEDKI